MFFEEKGVSIAAFKITNVLVLPEVTHVISIFLKTKSSPTYAIAKEFPLSEVNNYYCVGFIF